MKPTLLLLFVWMIGSNLAFANFEENEVKERVEGMNCLFTPKYNRVVGAYLQGYLVRNRSRTERMLGKSVLYFPLFEKKLAEGNLPQELKYLPIVESALNPKAVSPVGATGLWQFMPETGKDYGLRIDGEIDERYDPEKSTEAAIRYLTRLYERFGSWELAIAAYNCGGGRVSRAMRRARSADFWRVRRYLPRETRNYVPAFIAASYLSKFYDEHKLDPFYPKLDLQLTESIQIFERLSFIRVAQVTGLPLSTIEKLNPSFKDGYIPQHDRGYQLIVPRRVAKAVRDYIKIRHLDPEIDRELDKPVSRTEGSSAAPGPKYQRRNYLVAAGEQLDQVAARFNCSVHHILAWNRLKTGVLAAGQVLVIYEPAEFKRFRPELLGPSPLLADKTPPQVHSTEDPLARHTPSVPLVKKGKYWWYNTIEGETWESIAARFPELSLEELWEINKENPRHLRKPGKRVKIRRVK